MQTKKFLTVLLVFCAVGMAGVNNAASPSEKSAGEEIDRTHDTTTSAIQTLASRIDSFFVDDDHATFLDNKTRVRVRLNFDHIENHGFEYSTKAKLNLVLPGLKKRLSLVFNDGDSMDGDANSRTSDGDNDIAFRWLAKQSENTSYKVDLGLRVKNDKFDPFLRVNTSWYYSLGEEWQGRSSNRLYYYSNTGWRDDFRQYFERPLNDDMLFRLRTRVQFFEEKYSNPRMEQKLSLYQTIRQSAAIAYEVLWRQESVEDSLFRPRELRIPAQASYQQVQIRIRYRRSFWKPWMFFELWPLVGWAEERDWESTLGVRIRLEFNYGGLGKLALDE